VQYQGSYYIRIISCTINISKGARRGGGMEGRGNGRGWKGKFEGSAYLNLQKGRISAL
jgi:hypothetical protein